MKRRFVKRSLPIMPPLPHIPGDDAVRLVFGFASNLAPSYAVNEMRTINSLSFRGSVGKGGRLTVTVTVIPPASGQFYFKTMLAQVRTFHTNRSNHGRLCMSVTVTE